MVNLLFIFIIIAVSIFSLWQYFRFKRVLKERDKTLSSSRRIYQIILQDLDFDTVVQKIADTIPLELEFGTGIVAILDEQRGILRRVAASKTVEARDAIKALSVPFDQIEISIYDSNNLMARAVREEKPFITKDVYDVLGPILNKEEAKKIQEIMGTKTTLVYPIFLKGKVVGVFIASTKKEEENVSPSDYYIIRDFINIVGIVLQNSKLYSSLEATSMQLKYVNERLKELDKLKDDFVSIASHELRTPMTAIRSYVWMALYKSDITLSDKLKKYLDRTLISTERLINLVNDMLNISRIESGRIEILPKSFDIAKLCEDVLCEVEVKAKEKNLHLNLNLSQVPQVFADNDKVHQVLLNLIGNSLKFTPNEGTIEISLFSDGLVVEVSITDTGVGISKENQSKLFEKFGRVENSYVMATATGGTGLGLYISKSLVNLMGGKIWLKSLGEGKGSTFTFSLPAATRQVLADSAKYTKKVGEDAKPLEPVAI